MNFFPKITYQKKTALEATEIRLRLNKLLVRAKYDGFWENGYLIIERNNEFGRSSFNKITSRITLQIVELENGCMVSVKSKMKPVFEFQMGLFIVLMVIFQLFIIYVLIANHSFNLIVFGPPFFLLFSVCQKTQCLIRKRQI